ncbi:shikimate kinase [Ginsengibacter hankyongi]|nr:shikimate kinase [Ginsengibacter hankyongi]
MKRDETPDVKPVKGGEQIPEKKSKKVIALPVKIFLIGFMGSGKTHWGKIWAKNESLTFYDLDGRIKKAFKMSITEIFEKKGEEKFRELERYHLRKFESKKNFLLACGGGTPCFSDNMDWMKSQGKVFYLKAEPELLLQQVMHETEKRPVIKKVNPSELLFFIQKKLEEREPYYSQADVILNVDELNENSLSLFLTPTK